MRAMKLAVVVQRYGADIGGGAELHARYIAEHLAQHADVRVLTTCARDYITWRNEFPAGETLVNGVPVERFPVSRERNRNLLEFARRSRRVFDHAHSQQEELDWLDEEGPVSPALQARLADAGDEFDFVFVFSLRYHTAYHAARTVPERTILVPTVEREASLGLSIFPPILRGVRGIMYNSPEEQAMIHAVSGNRQVPGAVVGVGSEIPASPDAERARQTFGLQDPFVVYIGRIDANKGCDELFRLFEWYQRIAYLTLRDRRLDLILIGTAVIDIPSHPRIRHLGFVSDDDKFDVLCAAEALIMPSYFESLSMVALEAWALGKPVIANGRCDVLKGQCLRSNAGLYYESDIEFEGAINVLLDTPELADDLGRRGRAFYREQYDWPVIERKYLDLLDALRNEPPSHTLEPLPGFFGRRRRDCPPGAAVMASVPSGPVIAPDRSNGHSR